MAGMCGLRNEQCENCPLRIWAIRLWSGLTAVVMVAVTFDLVEMLQHPRGEVHDGDGKRLAKGGQAIFHLWRDRRIDLPLHHAVALQRL